MKIEAVEGRSRGYFLRPKDGIAGLHGGLDVIVRPTDLPANHSPYRRPNPDDVGTSLTDAEINKPVVTYERWQR